jgi:hypothetical protein
MESKNKFLNKTACFDLQFRKDIRHKRTGSPTYYSWKAQFVIAGSIDKEGLLREIKDILDCGRIHFTSGTQLRYSVQAVNDLHDKILPFFKKNELQGKKKYDFELWSKAIEIIHKNKGKSLSLWPKQNFQSLIDIQKEILKYKTKKTQALKWLPKAESLIEIFADNKSNQASS